MRLKIAILAVGLLCALPTAEAGTDDNLRRRIADLSSQNCKADRSIRKLQPNARARLCTCFAAKFSKSLSATDILYAHLGTDNKTVSAAWDRKSESALLACMNGKR